MRKHIRTAVVTLAATAAVGASAADPPSPDGGRADLCSRAGHSAC